MLYSHHKEYFWLYCQRSCNTKPLHFSPGQLCRKTVHQSASMPSLLIRSGDTLSPSSSTDLIRQPGINGLFRMLPDQLNRTVGAIEIKRLSVQQNLSAVRLLISRQYFTEVVFPNPLGATSPTRSVLSAFRLKSFKISLLFSPYRKEIFLASRIIHAPHISSVYFPVGNFPSAFFCTFFTPWSKGTALRHIFYIGCTPSI